MNKKIIISTLISAMSLTAYSECLEKLHNPTSEFEILEDGSALHKETGLIWYRCLFGSVFNNETQSCRMAAYNFDGGISYSLGLKSVYDFPENMKLSTLPTDAPLSQVTWRFPNVKEIKTILEPNCTTPFNPEIFDIPVKEFHIATSAFWKETQSVYVVANTNAEYRGNIISIPAIRGLTENRFSFMFVR